MSKKSDNPSSTSLGFLQGIFKECFGILSINRKILLENKSYYREGVALRMNQSFAFEFLCENFQPKLINFYSNFKRFFHFLLSDMGKATFLVVYILANNCTLLCFSLNHLLKIFSLITKILQSFFFNKKYLPKIKSFKKFFASEKILFSKIQVPKIPSFYFFFSYFSWKSPPFQAHRIPYTVRTKQQLTPLS